MLSPNSSREIARQFPQEDQPTPRRTLMRPRDVRAATGLSRSGIYRLIKDGRFPAPVRLTTNAVAFVVDEVQQYIDDRIAERDAAHGGAA